MKFCSASLMLLLSIGLLHAEVADEILLKVDAQASFLENDFYAVYRLIIEKPGEGRTSQTAEVYRRDSKEIFAIYLLEPRADKGKGYIGDRGVIELYDPKSRKFVRTQPGDRFQNGNARNADFTRSWFARDYKVLSSSPEKVGKFDCTLLKLEAKVEGLAFPKVSLWVDQEMRVIKKEDYGFSGQLMRVTVVPDYQEVAKRWIPKSIVIEDRLRGRKVDGKMVYERTSLFIGSPAIGPQPDLKFSKIGLEKEAQ